MASRADLKIGLLGELVVRRPDGSLVERAEWSTGKTMDLLRIVALSGNQGVRRSCLTDRLWPHAGRDRGLASLRTAKSQIRRATGMACLVRQGDAIRLVGAWVDVAVFLAEAKRVHSLARDGLHSRAVDLALAADRHYRGDFRAHDDESAWARSERDNLRETRKTMSGQAADSALAIGDLHRALAFADTAARIDPMYETACRARMTAYARLGEVGSALRVYEALRAGLADEMGADPSALTQELHLRLLRADAT
ncbi:bacterial transcriptional activator domain-containing protein [Nocardioides sp. cx-169]|uniref:AfsR/SARP family transcriptional regulator n=1 Tax=Nocardioides sp. cx-169 TaxID=2899080 RepID=UPI001E574626|nr:bacterial transcriptional activator domain-containing protein [Nocardioides sp. cx-169]MCD4536321.1 bacterial transcriptional activator domain-containing protein [Nocardioides sp. cx-169]